MIFIKKNYQYPDVTSIIYFLVDQLGFKIDFTISNLIKPAWFYEKSLILKNHY
jgi:hypothetical protein